MKEQGYFHLDSCPSRPFFLDSKLVSELQQEKLGLSEEQNKWMLATRKHYWTEMGRHMAKRQELQSLLAVPWLFNHAMYYFRRSCYRRWYQ